MKIPKTKGLRRYDGRNCFTFINCTMGSAFRFWLMTKLCGGSNEGIPDYTGGSNDDKLDSKK